MSRRTYKRRFKGGSPKKTAKPKPLSPKTVAAEKRLERTSQKILKYKEELIKIPQYNYTGDKKEIDNLKELLNLPKERVDKAKQAAKTRKNKNVKETKRVEQNLKRNVENYDKYFKNLKK